MTSLYFWEICLDLEGFFFDKKKVTKTEISNTLREKKKKGKNPTFADAKAVVFCSFKHDCSEA